MRMVIPGAANLPRIPIPQTRNAESRGPDRANIVGFLFRMRTNIVSADYCRTTGEANHPVIERRDRSAPPTWQGYDAASVRTVQHFGLPTDGGREGRDVCGSFGFDRGLGARRRISPDMVGVGGHGGFPPRHGGDPVSAASVGLRSSGGRACRQRPARRGSPGSHRWLASRCVLPRSHPSWTSGVELGDSPGVPQTATADRRQATGDTPRARHICKDVAK